KVCYLRGVSDERAAEGWSSMYRCEPYEQVVEDASVSEILFSSVPDWKDRIHVVSSYFNMDLIKYFCRHQVAWCHWSERPGIRLAETLGYRTLLFRLLYPIMLRLKIQNGFQIRHHALGALAQGVSAERAFRKMGVPLRKIRPFFYSPAPLPEINPASCITEFAAGRRVFLAVGRLCRRKGIDVLLRSFSLLNAENWCLVLCGLDESQGLYEKMAGDFGIKDRVLFLGAYPVERIAEVYSAADVFVLASRFDGWGAVLNEAASVGLPLIGTDQCGASWHIIQNGVNGYQVRAGSVHALQEAMRYYVNQPELIILQGEASRQLYQRDFHPKKNAERLIDALDVWSKV
ncbi:MAG TPA: glycosyltransferase family 4 protein, partial [Pontiella sp.]